MQYSNADGAIVAIEFKKLYTRSKRKKTDFRIKLFKYQEQLIFEIHWLRKIDPYQNTPLLTPKITIIKWHLQYEPPLRNFVLCAILN